MRRHVQSIELRTLSVIMPATFLWYSQDWEWEADFFSPVSSSGKQRCQCASGRREFSVLPICLPIGPVPADISMYIKVPHCPLPFFISILLLPLISHIFMLPFVPMSFMRPKSRRYSCQSWEGKRYSNTLPPLPSPSLCKLY